MKNSLRLSVATLAVLSFATVAQAAEEGDPAKGEKVFKKCKPCHAVGEDAKHKIGPQLNNIIDAKAGAQEGFKKYSKAIVEAGEGGLTWSLEKLDAYLKKPKEVVPKGKMPFPGLKKESDRADVITYLKTFSKKE